MVQRDLQLFGTEENARRRYKRRCRVRTCTGKRQRRSTMPTSSWTKAIARRPHGGAAVAHSG